MKAKLIKKMLKSGDYDHMTVSEFKRALDDASKFDIDVWSAEQEKLISKMIKGAFHPETTTHELGNKG